MSGIIPPSIILILYGVATETSIGALFIGSVIPGIMVMTVFIGIMMFHLRRSPSGLTRVRAETASPEVGFRQIVIALLVSATVAVVVFGGIYTGMATPTEAGAIGAFAAFLAALALGKVGVRFMKVSLRETTKVTGMVMLILIAALIFGRFVSLSLIPRHLLELLEPIAATPALMLVILAAIFFALFMFIEGAAVILMSVPVVMPIIQAMEIDVLWFGVFVAVICTTGLITPPVGLCVYAVSGATGVSSDSIFRHTLVFAAVATVTVCGMLILFPELALWLPTRGR
jgi:tripartite ATP-independent transporter DctM subunit